MVLAVAMSSFFREELEEKNQPCHGQGICRAWTFILSVIRKDDLRTIHNIKEDCMSRKVVFLH